MTLLLEGQDRQYEEIDQTTSKELFCLQSHIIQPGLQGRSNCLITGLNVSKLRNVLLHKYVGNFSLDNSTYLFLMSLAVSWVVCQ